MCDFIVNIPTSKEYAALNISHAAAIVFYELFKEQAVKAMDEKYRLAGKEEKQLILGLIEKLLDKTGFSTKEKKETQRRVWKRLVGKSFMTKREAYALIGFLKKLA
jgi:tRNA C32,U32 (ribose-2'-O)-methylase TrmJ